MGPALMMHALEVPEFKLRQPLQLHRTSITTWVPGAGIIQFGTINWGGRGVFSAASLPPHRKRSLKILLSLF